MPEYTFSINRYYAWLILSKDGAAQDGHYPVLNRLLNFTKDRGFYFGRDPEILRRYPSLSNDHWYGRKGDLEFKAKRYPAGFTIQFFQNVVFENTYGGYYDFDKYDKMPYLIRLRFQVEAGHMKAFLEGLGCADVSKPVYKLAKDRIKQHYVTSWHHPQESMFGFGLEDLHGQTPGEFYNRKDRDGKTIRNGEVKYYRDWKTGRLMRGVVYHNINNMWWVITSRYGYTNIAAFNLFDSTEADFRVRRLKKTLKNSAR